MRLGLHGDDRGAQRAYGAPRGLTAQCTSSFLEAPWGVRIWPQPSSLELCKPLVFLRRSLELYGLWAVWQFSFCFELVP